MIREVQLTNFMSYKTASVPLEKGLNLIVGPNGAGKSSILLAISVVLGQAYTERARKLSELIRWGEQESRISLKLDNISPKGPRPFPHARADLVTLTRILRRNGDYQYYLNNKPISKAELLEGLSRIGLNPDNMLVIMHQLMVGRFGSVSPSEKLLLLEDAIGFGSYRRDVLEATSRLQTLTTERETMSSVLEGTRETYHHWQREYEKYELKRKLEQQQAELQRELIWRRILRKEASQTRILERIARLQRDLDKAKRDFESSEADARKIAEQNSQLDHQLESTRQDQLKLEHSKGFALGAVPWIEKLEENLRIQEAMLKAIGGADAERLEKDGYGPDSLRNLLSQVGKEKEELSSRVKSEEAEYERVRLKMAEVAALLEKSLDSLVNLRVQREVSEFKVSSLSDQMADLDMQLKLGNEELEPLQAQASKLGPRFDNPRDMQVITLDIASVQERLRPLSHLSDEVEKMFRSYGELYEDLRKKATLVEQNRAEVLGELQQRFERWKSVMGKLLDDLSSKYDSLLNQVGGTGRLILRASKDIDKAGLELQAGFKGNEPVSLDSLTPSGGERTISLIAFLLSLQQFISSSFRAIDEFDVHMDPKNRETISRLIYAAAASNDSSQYIAITPGHLNLPSENDVHVIVVQNVEGTSSIRELKNN